MSGKPEVKVGFFQEAEGVNSSMRLNSSLTLYTGLFIIIFTVVAPVLGIKVETGTNLTAGFSLIGAGLGFKTMQKFGERKRQMVKDEN